MRLDDGVILFLGTGAVLASSADWPVYRHDAALSGVSPGKGRILMPAIQWEYYLGAPRVALATDRASEPPNTADLDGDGTLEKFSLNSNTLVVTDLSSRPLWSFTVTGHPPGGNVRVAKLFPDRKGQQIVSFSHRMDTGEGQGYCFTFDQGATNGELAWTTGPLASHRQTDLGQPGGFSTLPIVVDLDGDGRNEIVVQNAAGEILALAPGRECTSPPVFLVKSRSPKDSAAAGLSAAMNNTISRRSSRA